MLYACVVLLLLVDKSLRSCKSAVNRVIPMAGATANSGCAVPIPGGVKTGYGKTWQRSLG